MIYAWQLPVAAVLEYAESFPVCELCVILPNVFTSQGHC